MMDDHYKYILSYSFIPRMKAVIVTTTQEEEGVGGERGGASQGGGESELNQSTRTIRE